MIRFISIPLRVSFFRNLAFVILGIAAMAAFADDLPPVNTPPTTDYFPGKFVWADLVTADPAAAGKFYTGLFGWTAATVERPSSSGKHSYIVLSTNGRPIAGIALRRPQLKTRIHGRWIGFVSVPNVAQTLAAATDGGGHVLFPTKDHPRRGTQAVFTDREGATLGILQSSSGDPGEFKPDPGDWTWAELFAHDPDADSLYYHNVFGYDVMPDTRSESSKSFVFVSGGYSRASLAPLRHATSKSAWVLFVRVANVKAAVAKATSLGGRVLVAPTDAPTEYWRAIIADPSGAAMYWLSWMRPSLKRTRLSRPPHETVRIISICGVFSRRAGARSRRMRDCRLFRGVAGRWRLYFWRLRGTRVLQ